jgi:hypothetical protein
MLEELADAYQHSLYSIAPSPYASSNFGKADMKFATNVSEFTKNGHPLFSKQVPVAQRILLNHVYVLERIFEATAEQITNDIRYPVFRMSVRESRHVPREVRYIGKRKLAFSAKKSDEITSRIKQLNTELGLVGVEKPYFNRDYAVWIVEVYEDTYDKICKLIKKQGFQFDDNVLQFMAACENSVDTQSESKIEESNIVIAVQNDPFLSGWLEQVLDTEGWEDV